MVQFCMGQIISDQMKQMSQIIYTKDCKKCGFNSLNQFDETKCPRCHTTWLKNARPSKGSRNYKHVEVIGFFDTKENRHHKKESFSFFD